MFVSFIAFLLRENTQNNNWTVQPYNNKVWQKSIESANMTQVASKRLQDFLSIINKHPNERSREDLASLTLLRHHPITFPAGKRGKAAADGISTSLQKMYPGSSYTFYQTHLKANNGNQLVITLHKDNKGDGPNVLLFKVGNHTTISG